MAQEIETPDELKYQFQPASNGVLNFAVRAANDAHIALTSGPEESDPMYEVFIGGWSNSKSVIRKNRTKPDVAEKETPDVLSPNEFRRFWIRWQNGTISAGRDGEAEPFLTFTDSEVVPIGYFGICTGWGANGTWLIEGDPREILTKDCGDMLTYTFRAVLRGFFEFEVKSPSNAHVALTSGPRETDPMYEIMLGGWENSASCIRYKREKPDKVHVNTPQLLSASEFRHFSIEWRDGEISVVHNSRVLMKWTDPSPFPITHAGVRTGWGAAGTWRIHKVPLGFSRVALSATMPATEGLGTRKEDEGEEELRETNPENKDGDDEEEEEEKEEEEEGEKDAEEEGGDEEEVPEPSAPPAPVAASGGSVLWERRANGELPDGAFEGGVDSETGEKLYVGRAEHEGAIIPGKFVPSHGVTYVSWGGAEHGKPEYEILCGCQGTWVKSQNGEVPANAIEGGKSEDGETLYIGRVDDGEKLVLGKVHVSHQVFYAPYGGSELSYPEYEVLVANN